MAAPAAASLVAIDSLSLGTAGSHPRELAMARVEEFLRQGFAEGGAGEVPELTIRGIAGGLRRIGYRFLRAGQPERMAGHVEELVDWALGYQRAGRGAAEVRARGAPVSRAPVGGALRAPAAAGEAEGGDGRPGWEEPPSSKLSRRALSQRERIVRAVARLAAAKGFAHLSVPAISGAAGVSNQTFYQEFASKQEAFLEAFDTLAEQALRQTIPALQSQQEWPGAVEAALGAVLSFLAASPLFAQLAFFELPAAGLIGLEHAETVLGRFTALLQPEALPAGVESPPEIAIDATSGGVFTVIQHEISHGRAEALPRLTHEIAAFALAPYGLA